MSIPQLYGVKVNNENSNKSFLYDVSSEYLNAHNLPYDYRASALSSS